MGRVCRKHEEFYEEACRWCEPPIEVPVASAPFRRCVYWAIPACTKPVAWVWKTDRNWPVCEEHHAAWLGENAHKLDTWTRERLP